MLRRVATVAAPTLLRTTTTPTLFTATRGFTAAAVAPDGDHPISARHTQHEEAIPQRVRSFPKRQDTTTKLRDKNFEAIAEDFDGSYGKFQAFTMEHKIPVKPTERRQVMSAAWKMRSLAPTHRRPNTPPHGRR